MSNKIVNSTPELSTEVVDKKTGEILTVPRYVPPRLNKAGQECPSAITLTAVPALRDFDLGTRIQRFQRAPESVQARYDASYDPDDADFDNHVDTDDVNPMSEHELRMEDVRSSFRDKEKERIKKRDEEKAEKLKADKKAFSDLYKSLREEGAIPSADLPSKDA